MIFKPPQVPDYQPASLKEAETMQRFYNDLFALSHNVSVAQ
jgi:hypothetical protein